MTKKLYVREITFRAYVYAEDESQAEGYDYEIVGGLLGPDKADTYEVDLTAPGDEANPLGWQKHSLVYCDECDDDLFLHQVLPSSAWPTE